MLYMVMFKEETKKILSTEKLLAKVHPPHVFTRYTSKNSLICLVEAKVIIMVNDLEA